MAKPTARESGTNSCRAAPTMKNEDVLLLHRLWLNITREPGLENVHHHEILTEALTRFAHDYGARDREDILKELRRTSADQQTSLPRRTAGPTHPVQAEPTHPGPDGPVEKRS